MRAIPQSLSAVYLHAIFSTKERQGLLRDRGLSDELHAYLGGVSNQLDCPPLQIGGTEDHVHVLARFGRRVSQADWIKEIKRVSSRWIKEREAGCRKFSWQAGYAIFSVSPSNLDAVRRYIATQEQRHRKITFQDEFRALLRKHGLEWDERYVWD